MANRRAFIGLGVISGVINLLMLTGPLFMIQIYDRVLASRSLPTLITLAAIAVAAYVLQGWLDAIRSRALGLIGERIDAAVAPDIHRAVMDLPLRAPASAQETLQPFRDLEAIRAFMAGHGPNAFFDLPWLPVYLGFCYLLHPVLGIVAAGAALILILITGLADICGAGPTGRAMQAQSAGNRLADQSQRNAEVIRAMGMLPALTDAWRDVHERYLVLQRRSGFVLGGLSAMARASRLIAQSCMLGVAAWLAVKGEISDGTIIAVSILASRALAPVDQAIAGWRGFVAAREGYRRLAGLLTAPMHPGATFALPAPCRGLKVEGLWVAAPGSQKPIVRNLGFSLEAGQRLGIVGASASGKSSLARALVGAWAVHAGRVTLDGADIRQWPADRLGRHIGYLPQNVQLFEATVAQNIGRLQASATSDAVIAAARGAGFHEQILALPAGYETRIGLAGIELSAGQKQRVGLARALFGDPFLVVLDEPNANLDIDGESALKAAIEAIGRRGGIAIVIAHRMSILAGVDLLAVMRAGEIVTFGPRQAVAGPRISVASAADTRGAPGEARRRAVESE